MKDVDVFWPKEPLVYIVSWTVLGPGLGKSNHAWFATLAMATRHARFLAEEGRLNIAISKLIPAKTRVEAKWEGE